MLWFYFFTAKQGISRIWVHNFDRGPSMIFNVLYLEN